MREQELFGLIKQCDLQKTQISSFMEDVHYEYLHSVGSTRMRLKKQNIKYLKRKSVLNTRLLHAKHQLVLKGHNIEMA